MELFKFETLDVYQLALEFSGKIFRLSKNWPREYLFDLTSQFRRAALSIPLNIAEGSSGSKKDFARFIDISRGSINECVALIELVYKQSLIDINTKEQLRESLIVISKMLSKLKSSVRNNYEPRTNNS